MSCIHCIHCRAIAKQQEELVFLHPRGTRLLITNRPDRGVVTYWRAAPEVSDRVHVVYCETSDCEVEDECGGHYVQTKFLAPAPA